MWFSTLSFDFIVLKEFGKTGSNGMLLCCDANNINCVCASWVTPEIVGTKWMRQDGERQTCLLKLFISTHHSGQIKPQLLYNYYNVFSLDKNASLNKESSNWLCLSLALATPPPLSVSVSHTHLLLISLIYITLSLASKSISFYTSSRLMAVHWWKQRY